jgi:hypothetical protein
MYLDFCNVLKFLFYASILERRDGSDLSKDIHVEYSVRIDATQWGTNSAEIRAASFLRDMLETISGTSKEIKERTKSWFGFHK